MVMSLYGYNFQHVQIILIIYKNILPSSRLSEPGFELRRIKLECGPFFPAKKNKTITQ